MSVSAVTMDLMREGARVSHRDDPEAVGTILATDGEEAVVWWDMDFSESGEWATDENPVSDDRVYAVDDLVEIDGEKIAGPADVYAPAVQPWQFVTRLHPVTDSLVMERDPNYPNAPGPALLTPEDVYLAWQHMSELDQEHIVVIMTDVRNNLTGWKVAHKGQLASVEASARDILKDALLTNAARVILLHNHPSGDPSPSEADCDLTQALEFFGNEFGVDLYDHVIIGRDRPDASDWQPFFSFRDAGLIEDPPPE